MKNMFIVLLTLCISVLFFIGCEDNPLPFESTSNTNENNFVSKALVETDNFSMIKRADKFIEQAQAKIDKASEKADAAILKCVGLDLTAVYAKIGDAQSLLDVEAAAAYIIPDYEAVIEFAKEAKELASEALDDLEVILDGLDCGGNSFTLEQADKFIEQAQAKIDKASEKADAAILKCVGLDLTAVYAKIGDAQSLLDVEAAAAYIIPDYEAVIEFAKEAKELASEALDDLEVILDGLDCGGNSFTLEQADKFIEQAQAKIDKASEKADAAILKCVGLDLTAVYAKIGDAQSLLDVEAAAAYIIPDYEAVIEFAKEAKELASEALDDLEVILDGLDCGGNSFTLEQADKFIEQAQAKIDKASEKADAAILKCVGLDLTAVYAKIGDAQSLLDVEAAAAYIIPDYEAVIEFAKEAKELASEALDDLEVILDGLDCGGNSFTLEQADKFIEQAQAKIDKASEKADAAILKYVGLDLTAVYAKIGDAQSLLDVEVAAAYIIPDYEAVIEFAKEAKELASEALDDLEVILDGL